MRRAADARTAPRKRPQPQRAAAARRDRSAFLADEAASSPASPSDAAATADERQRIAELAARLVRAARANRHEHGGVDAFMHEYGLTSEEGIILMCLAEALLRIPDADTADALIAEKIGGGRWEKHLGASDSLFVNASTFGLMLTGRVVQARRGQGRGAGRHPQAPGRPLRRALHPPGPAPGHEILGDNFVLGRTIEEALEPRRATTRRGAIASPTTCWASAPRPPPTPSATSTATWRRSRRSARPAGAGSGDRACADGAAQRVGEALRHPPALRAGQGGAARARAAAAPRRAGRRRAPARPRPHHRRRGAGPARPHARPVRRRLLRSRARRLAGPRPRRAGLRQARRCRCCGWLQRLAEHAGKRIPVRLVKGAYWDSEIKWAQERGLADYPVFTRKAHTDVSYLACVRQLLADPAAFFPQFATHNAQSIASVYVAAGAQPSTSSSACTAWARRSTRRWSASGKLERALPHLRAGRPARGPRRLPRAPPARERRQHLLRQPPGRRGGADRGHHPRSRRERGARARAGRSGGCRGRPTSIAPERCNSAGLALSEPAVRAPLLEEIAARARSAFFAAAPIVDGKTLGRRAMPAELVLSPHDRRQRVGTVRTADPAAIEAALASAQRRARTPGTCSAARRARDILERAADLYERDRARLMAVMVREAGKTLENALGDVREAVDFLRYYAAEARRLFGAPVALRGPDRRDQHAGAAGARAVRLHLALELSARHLHRPGGGGAGGRQPGARQARRADADHRLPRRPAAARGGRAAERAASAARRRRGRRGARQGPARRRRRLHRLQRDGLGDPAGAGRRGAAPSCPSSPRPAASTP